MYNFQEPAGLPERRHKELVAHKLSVLGQHDVSRRSAMVSFVQVHTKNAGGGRDMDSGRPVTWYKAGIHGVTEVVWRR